MSLSVKSLLSASELVAQFVVQTGAADDTAGRLSKLEQQVELLRNLLQDASNVVTSIGLFAIVVTVVSLIVIFISLTAFIRDWIYNARDRETTATNVKLVNDLLSVAERATRQAADAQLKYLKNQIVQIGERCDELIGATRDDDRSIVTESKHRAEVREYAQTIAALEPQIQFHQFVDKDASLTNQDDVLDLSASCFFIRGMDYHIQQNHVSAVRNWVKARDARGHGRIEALIARWLAYEYNNTNRFRDAVAAVDSVSEKVTPAEWDNLCKVRFESLFFSSASNDEVKELIDGASSYLGNNRGRMDPHVIGAFRILLGNMYWVSGVIGGDETALNQAVDNYTSAGKDDVWANFGLAQCYDAMKRPDKRDDIARKTINKMLEQYNARQEPRSKLLRKTTEYICHMWIEGQPDILRGVRYAIEREASDVDPELTVYSQVRKRNITKVEFLREMSLLFDNQNLVQTMKQMEGFIHPPSARR